MCYFRNTGSEGIDKIAFNAVGDVASATFIDSGFNQSYLVKEVGLIGTINNQILTLMFN